MGRATRPTPPPPLPKPPNPPRPEATSGAASGPAVVGFGAASHRLQPVLKVGADLAVLSISRSRGIKLCSSGMMSSSTFLMVKGGEIGDFGGGSREPPRRWLGAQWLGPTLGAPSCPEPQGAP